MLTILFSDLIIWTCKQDRLYKNLSTNGNDTNEDMTTNSS